MTPMQRSLELLRSEGYLVAKVEQYNPYPKPFGHTVDLWNFADILAIRRGSHLLVQTTTGSNMAARRSKMADNPMVEMCLEAGMEVELHGWTPYKVKRGGTAITCELKREKIDGKTNGG